MNNINCSGCGKLLIDEIDIWDKENELCPDCSMENAKLNKQGKYNNLFKAPGYIN